MLLPVGEQAQFRLEENKLLLRVESVDSKEREYIVVSMMPRGDSTADASSGPSEAFTVNTLAGGGTVVAIVLPSG